MSRHIITMVLSVAFVSSPGFAFGFSWNDVNKEISKYKSKENKNSLTTEDIGNGLKEALTKGVTKGANKLSQKNGFYGNKKVKIPFPKEFKGVKKTLIRMGYKKRVKQAILRMNRAAERAVKDSVPIFKKAILAMSFDDAKRILSGKNQQAASDYLKKKTTSDLVGKFSPTVKHELDKVNATKAWRNIVRVYNRLPFKKKINPDLVQYVTQRTIAGLFVMVADEEKLIRKDPAKRTTDLLRRVFASR